MFEKKLCTTMAGHGQEEKKIIFGMDECFHVGKTGNDSYSFEGGI